MSGMTAELAAAGDIIAKAMQPLPSHEAARILKRLGEMGQAYKNRCAELEERMSRTQEEEAFLIFHCGATWALIEAELAIERMLGMRK